MKIRAGKDVVRQEAGADARQDRRHEGGGYRALDVVLHREDVRIDEGRRCRDADDPGGQTVEAVDEVHRVHGDQHSDDGEQRPGERVEDERAMSGPGK